MAADSEDHRSLRHHRDGGPRRHGRALSRPRLHARARRRAQDDARRLHDGPDRARAVPARGQGRRPPAAPQRRHHPRAGRGRGHALHRDGVPERQGPRDLLLKSGDAAAARRRSSTSRASSARASATRTSRASSIATSSPATCACSKTARSRSSTSASRSSRVSSVTQSGTIMGTPSYMSPEQIMGQPVDGRADLFSAGVLLYEMLAGKKPFTGDAPTAVVYQIMHVEPPPVRERRCRSCPRALARDRGARAAEESRRALQPRQRDGVRPADGQDDARPAAESSDGTDPGFQQTIGPLHASQLGSRPATAGSSAVTPMLDAPMRASAAARRRMPRHAPTRRRRRADAASSSASRQPSLSRRPLGCGS